MLKLRRGTVVIADDPADGPWQQLTVDLAGERRPAVADVALVGACAFGDEVVVNVEARDLALGSGGFDVVHVNLTSGLDGEGLPGAHVMKLNYTSLQHAVLPVEGETLKLPLGRPVAAFPLHGHLAPVAWAIAQLRPGTRVGYVQTAGGALPGAMSATVRELRARGLLVEHVTAGPSFGGADGEAITTAGALHDGLAERGWEIALAGPGPGILGSGSALGHGGIVALDTAHAALALGCPTVLVARMSSGDPRPRHQGLSHHTRTVLELLLGPVTLPVPLGAADPAFADARRRGHVVHEARADLAGYRASGLPARTMGRELEEDEPFFAAALAAGTTLAGMVETA
ncbi:DUF3866 family protein [Conexibacter arvalis]|uniref:DUF3866 domain-containing protein n=1 Tax=Conexibacter arvalis TaxID=912552 RepID=A0A840ILK0_9ACTN|nr:hypothetical protein [Conexibacter arvalis]